MSVPPAWVTQHPPVHHPKNPILGFHGRDEGPEWTSSHQCTSWAAFIHSASDVVHHNLFLFGRSVHWMGCIYSFRVRCGSLQSISFCCWQLYLVFFFGSWLFSTGPNLTHNYPTHLPTFISTPPTLVPYLLAVLIINNFIELIPYMSPYWHKYFTNLLTLIK